MPTKDRQAFEEAFDNKSEDQIRALLQQDDAKELLLMKDNSGWLPIHDACWFESNKSCLQLILDAGIQHGIANEMFEEKTNKGWTCLHLACRNNLSTDSLRLLISFFPSKDFVTSVLEARDSKNKKAIDYADNDEVKQLLGDPDCFEKCALWLFLNHQDTFLYSLNPNSFEKTCEALSIALMTSSPSMLRDAINKTDSSAPMANYFNVAKKRDKKNDYHNWRKILHFFREFCGRWPPSERKTSTTYEGEGSSSCSIQ